MDLEQLREYLSDITLEEILKIDTELGVLRMYFKNFKDIPSIPEETLVFYDEISDISALVEKKYPEFLKQICGYDKVKFVRATEYVLKEQPNIGIEDLNVFAELAEARDNGTAPDWVHGVRNLAVPEGGYHISTATAADRTRDNRRT